MFAGCETLPRSLQVVDFEFEFLSDEAGVSNAGCEG